MKQLAVKVSVVRRGSYFCLFEVDTKGMANFAIHLRKKDDIFSKYRFPSSRSPLPTTRLGRLVWAKLSQILSEKAREIKGSRR